MNAKLRRLASRLVVVAKSKCELCIGKGRYISCDEYHGHSYECSTRCLRCKKLDDELEEALSE